MKGLRLFLILALVNTTTFAETQDLSKGKDPRKGVRADKLLKGEIQTVTKEPQQQGGSVPLLTNLFKPTLAEWQRNGQQQKLTPSKFIYEGDTKLPDSHKGVVEEVSDLSRMQYFFSESLHAELKGKRAAEILKFTHSDKGKVYVSTTIEKIYPEKKYTDSDTGVVEKAQCIDVLTRITVTKVPLVNRYGLKSYVDFWQDFKNYQCHSNSKED